MKIDEIYKAVFYRGLAARRSGAAWFIYKEPNDHRITKVAGLSFRDLLDARKEVYYPAPVDIMAEDWEIITFTFGRVNDGATA